MARAVGKTFEGKITMASAFLESDRREFVNSNIMFSKNQTSKHKQSRVLSNILL